MITRSDLASSRCSPTSSICMELLMDMAAHLSSLLALLCLYQTYRILIYRPFCAWQSGLGNLLPQAMQECKTAADHIMRYVRILKETNDARRAPYTLQ